MKNNLENLSNENLAEKPKYHIRCGVLFGFTGATWPFGYFSIFQDRVEIGLLFEHYKILFHEINSISKGGFLPFAFPVLGKGVRIKTSRKDIPKHITVYSNQYEKIYNFILKQMKVS